MNRNELVRHLQKHDCVLVREGNRHSIYQNQARLDLISAVPRHSPVKIGTVLRICRELGIPKPGSR